MDLGRIGQDHGGGGVRQLTKVDRGGEGRPQELLDLVDDRLERTGGARLRPAAERENLSDEIRGVLGAARTSRRWSCAGEPCGHADRGQLRVAGNDAQEVVEVVGDAARQGADGLHLLGLLELGLEALPLGDVAPDGRHADDGAGRVLERREAEGDVDPGAGLASRTVS